MSKYTISMDYIEFQRHEKAKNDLKELKLKLQNCIERQDNTYLFDIKQLKQIAKEQLPYEIDEGDIIIDV